MIITLSLNSPIFGQPNNPHTLAHSLNTPTLAYSHCLTCVYAQIDNDEKDRASEPRQIRIYERAELWCDDHRRRSYGHGYRTQSHTHTHSITRTLTYSLTRTLTYSLYARPISHCYTHALTSLLNQTPLKNRTRSPSASAVWKYADDTMKCVCRTGEGGSE